MLPWIDQTLQRLQRKRVGKPTAVLAITPLDNSDNLEESGDGVA